MKVIIENINGDAEEELVLRCHGQGSETMKLIDRIRGFDKVIIGMKDDEIHRIPIGEILYFEVVENRSFIYCENDVYETKMKLYEFEEKCQGTAFFRASKSVVLNSYMIDWITPSFSGRYEAVLFTGEKVIVSRQYAAELKQRLGVYLFRGKLCTADK